MARRSAQVTPEAQAAKEADAVLDYALTADEKELCQSIVVFGPDYLRQSKGWKAVAIKQFLARAEVQREVNNLKHQYEDRTGLQERTQFFSQIRMNGMVPAALGVVARALRGTFQDASGQVVQAPTKQQLEAAEMVLERANIQGQKFGGNDQTPLIDARSVHLSLGGATDNLNVLGAEGREKVRGIVNAVLSRSRAASEAGATTAQRRASIENRTKTVEAEVEDGEDADR